MAIYNIPDHRAIPRLDEPATVVGLTLIVSVQCKHCTDTRLIGLLNSQPAVCEGCGSVFTLDAVTWEKGSATPQIALSAIPPRVRALEVS